MSKETYKQKTPYLGIPVLGTGDRIKPQVELRKYTIFENMLIAGTQGMKEVVFDDGDYQVESDGDQFVVNVRAGGTYPSIHGMVGGFYFRAPARVKWEGLKANRFYYLYIRPTPNTPHENWSVRAVSSTYQLDKDSLLVATIDFTKEVPVLDSNPDGKIYSQDVARHASDSSNPHGRQVIQDELTIQKLLRFSEGAKIEIAGSAIPLDDFVKAAASMAGSRTEVIDFETGEDGMVVLRASGKVLSVEVHQRGDIRLRELGPGSTAIGYFGEDDNADEECEFVVYNTGDKGMPMRALVVCG